MKKFLKEIFVFELSYVNETLKFQVGWVWIALLILLLVKACG